MHISCNVLLSLFFFVGSVLLIRLVFLCCPIYVSLRSEFRIENEVRFVFTSNCLQKGSFLIYVICVCLLMMVSNIYCVVFLFSFSSSCVNYVASFSGLSILLLPLRYSLTLIIYFITRSLKYAGLSVILNKITYLFCLILNFGYLVRPFGLLAPKDFLWAYLMKVIPETRHAQYNIYI